MVETRHHIHGKENPILNSVDHRVENTQITQIQVRRGEDLTLTQDEDHFQEDQIEIQHHLHGVPITGTVVNTKTKNSFVKINSKAYKSLEPDIKAMTKETEKIEMAQNADAEMDTTYLDRNIVN